MSEAKFKRGEEYEGGVIRYEDMSPKGHLRLHRQLDGDVILSVRGKDMSGRPHTASVEFCTGVGGGQSRHTQLALIKLIEAVKKDNEERPQDRS